MKTPIVDFARQYAESDALRLHMPGHKGHGFLGVEALDLTEIEGADVLYHAKGIIRESEENAASIFGTKKTVYSTEGSSLCIRAMLYLTALYAKTHGRSLKILAGRNAHKTFMTAAALLHIDVDWLFSEQSQSIVSCNISAVELEKILSHSAPAAVYLTTPDYLGNLVDIRTIAEVCHRHGVLLLVDNAHGAYLKFFGQHPMDLGADLCCDSAHKTLPVLTGGAYLHIGKSAPELFCAQVELAMSIFASTSPSYLILQSLDAENYRLSEGYQERLIAFADEISELKQSLQAYRFVGDEPLKLTISAKSYGYTGEELAKLLQKKNIFCEFADPDFLVMMLTPEVGIGGLARLKNALLSVEQKEAIRQTPPPLPRAVVRLSMHEALFSPSLELPVSLCLGKILAAPSITCPPAVPILVCGEQIDEAAVECMAYYGIDTCRVIDTTF